MRNRKATKHDKARSVLIVVENLPVPFDRRVWQEATALSEAGYQVSVICPKGKGFNAAEEQRDGINIYRHPMPFEASGPLGYLLEYSVALFWEFALSLKVLRRHGFDVIHACNPPDLIFLVAAFHKVLFGKRFLFDQHDINPELFEVKFGRRGPFHRLLLLFERCTFRLADVSIAPNETFRQIAITRGRMAEDRVWVVKSYPDLERFRIVNPDPALKNRFDHLVGYVGIMGKQDGVDLLVRAMAHIVGTLGRTDIGCLIVGDGPEHAGLVTLAKEFGVERQVVFAGYLSGDELLSHLSALDIGIIPDPPNVCNDKLSMNKVFEYSALGIPFVQFDLAQARSEAGEAALVVDEATAAGLADGILRLLSDELSRKRMSAYGKARAQKEFQWSNEKRNLLAAYEALFAPQARSARPAREGVATAKAKEEILR